MKSGVGTLRSMAYGFGPPMPQIDLSSWPDFISSLEIGLDFTKDGGNLIKAIETYPLEGVLTCVKRDIEKFLDCIDNESKKIERFYQDKTKIFKFELPKEIYPDINYNDLSMKFINYSRDQGKDNSEKFYCKLIADLRFATKIILGKESGPLGNYKRPFENILDYFRKYPYSKENSWNPRSLW